MKILAIETSCDDTGIAIIESDKNSRPKLLANLVSSQVKIHAKWGGVVPTLAKREHQRNLVPLLERSLREVALSPLRHSERSEESRGLSATIRSFAPLRQLADAGAQDDAVLKTILSREPELLKKLIPFLNKYQKPDIDAIAVTVGPGLEPALWVGVNFARALGYFWNLPIIPVNHIEAHICANWFPYSVIPAKAGIQKINWMPDQVRHDNNIKFPAICLVVSGGHTQLILIKKFGQYKIIGETRDDAAGEAFDKVAKMLNLGYPGGPAISRLTEEWKSKIRDPKFKFNDIASLKDLRCQNIKLPRPMLNSGDFDFSFSGLKTAVLYLLQKLTPAQVKKYTPAICAEFQQAVADVLVAKTIAAAKKYKVKTIMLSGGVAANDLLRQILKQETKKIKPQTNRQETEFFVPQKMFCTDNAAMTAMTAYLKIKNKSAHKTKWQNLAANANLRIERGKKF